MGNCCKTETIRQYELGNNSILGVQFNDSFFHDPDYHKYSIQQLNQRAIQLVKEWQLAENPNNIALICCLMALKQEGLLRVINQLQNEDRTNMIKYLQSIRFENMDSKFYHLTHKEQQYLTSKQQQFMQIGKPQNQYQQISYGQVGVRYEKKGVGIISANQVVWVIDCNDFVYSGQKGMQYQGIIGNNSISILEQCIQEINRIYRKNDILNPPMIIVICDENDVPQIEQLCLEQIQLLPHCLLSTPILTTSGKSVFLSPQKLLLSSNGPLHSLSHLIRTYTLNYEYVVFLPLDHLNYRMDYEYVLGMTHSLNLQIVGAIDSQQCNSFWVLKASDLQDIRNKLIEAINNFQAQQVIFDLYNYTSDSYFTEQLIVYSNSLDNLLPLLPKNLFLLHNRQQFSLKNKELPQSKISQQSHNLQVISKFNKELLNNPYSIFGDRQPLFSKRNRMTGDVVRDSLKIKIKENNDQSLTNNFSQLE